MAADADRWTHEDAYERRVGRWSRLVARDFLAWLGMPAGRRWLDVGSGTGALAAAIATACAPRCVHAVDSSAADLAYARAHAIGGGAALIVGDAAALPLGDTNFDAVVSGLSVNQFREPRQGIAEMMRVATSGGTVAAYVWDFGGEMQPHRRFWDAAIALDVAAAAVDQARKFPLCRLEALASLFAAAGLEQVETRTIDVPAEFGDFDDFWLPFVTGGGSVVDYTRSLPAERLVELRELLRQTLPTHPDGRIVLIARAFAVRGLVG